jgi:hypothetical protein
VCTCMREHMSACMHVLAHVGTEACHNVDFCEVWLLTDLKTKLRKILNGGN